MSYVDEVYERVVRENPSQPDFHQAVREVLDNFFVFCVFFVKKKLNLQNYELH